MITIIITLVDPNDDDFTANDPHMLRSGDAIKLSAQVAPTGTVNNTIYYARVINSTKFSIHPTAANARDGVNQIAISSSGESVTFLVGEPQIKNIEVSKTVNHRGTEPVAPVFSDYSKELKFVEGINTDYSRMDVLHTTAMKSVFGKGITTSPTYIFTQDAPKAAPGPPEINEVWIVS